MAAGGRARRLASDTSATKRLSPLLGMPGETVQQHDGRSVAAEVEAGQAYVASAQLTPRSHEPAPSTKPTQPPNSTESQEADNPQGMSG